MPVCWPVRFRLFTGGHYPLGSGHRDSLTAVRAGLLPGLPERGMQVRLFGRHRRVLLDQPDHPLAYRAIRRGLSGRAKYLRSAGDRSGLRAAAWNFCKSWRSRRFIVLPRPGKTNRAQKGRLRLGRLERPRRSQVIVRWLCGRHENQKLLGFPALGLPLPPALWRCRNPFGNRTDFLCSRGRAFPH